MSDRIRAELDSTEFLFSDESEKADTGSGLPKPRVLAGRQQSAHAHGSSC